MLPQRYALPAIDADKRAMIDDDVDAISLSRRHAADARAAVDARCHIFRRDADAFRFD